MKKNMMAAITLLTLTLFGCGSGGGGGWAAAVPSYYTVDFNAGTHGSLSGAASQKVTSGAATSAVLAVPATGYHFVNWTGDNGFVTSTTNPLTVSNVTAGQSITANFAGPSSAVLKLSSAGTLASGSSLLAINVKVQLPTGVTISADGSNVVNAGVITASGVAAASSVTIVGYTLATATAPATLEFLISSNVAGGFGVGEFATVNCLIVAGNFPATGDFILPSADFKPADILIQPVAGLTASLTATIN